ncbi:hypothetical protein A2480_02965 [Candidatus Uhrbacteria bacterium RIFOXYC2_FULL_47_19]|uniref:Uncharacterized protein n=1 Tax=Candidatus Uhrbacteria bacterium RIFOXYC2_FULL_47_19 TaxID=1802424 RepID=A0A1F7WGE1_9BACT|nr:MAG: hypothetical protein A2480_02965 [Candidatus Uhrbacteria bacterium RIFOXYC2_FULL_47_19]HCC22312.1 hypothetical protein [Candidatus Uhrbacteria bacterium]
MHNVYDVRSQSSYTTLLPYPEKDQKLGNHVWCYLTALKVIEDIGIFSSLDLELPFLREISCDIRPMNEDADRLELYFEGLRNLYANEPNLDKYGRLFCDWGLGREVVDSVLAAAAEIDADANIKSRALAIYEEVLKNFKIRNI